MATKRPRPAPGANGGEADGGRRRNKRARLGLLPPSSSAPVPAPGDRQGEVVPGTGALLSDVTPESRAVPVPAAAPDDESRRVLLPPRDEQTAWAVAYEGLTAADDVTARLSLIADGPLVRYIARAQLEATGGTPLPAPLPLMLTLFSERFYQLASPEAAPPAPSENGSRRLAKGHAPVANYRMYAPRLRAMDAQRIYDAFYADDGFDDATPFGQTDPHTYPMFRELVRHHQEAFQARERLEAAAVGDTARVVRPESLPRAYFTAFRMPPSATSQLCASGRDCLFLTLDPTFGYVGRAFLLPDGTPATPRGQPPLCIDCLLFDWKQRVMEALNLGRVPPEPINTFCVFRGAGEYDEQCLLRELVENRPTGIAGDVPMYDRKWRSYEPITTAQRRQYGIERGQAPTGTYLAEVFTDFRHASAAPVTRQ